MSADYVEGATLFIQTTSHEVSGVLNIGCDPNEKEERKKDEKLIIQQTIESSERNLHKDPLEKSRLNHSTCAWVRVKECSISSSCSLAFCTEDESGPVTRMRPGRRIEAKIQKL